MEVEEAEPAGQVDATDQEEEAEEEAAEADAA